MSAASRSQCACGRTRDYGEAGWRLEPAGQALCPTCHSRRCRERGSSLRPPTGPPRDVLAAAPWKQPRPAAAKPKPRPKSRPKPAKPKPAKPRAPTARERAELEVRRDPNKTIMEVADQLGVSRNTVLRARRRLREAGALPTSRKRNAPQMVSNSKPDSPPWRPSVKERARRELLRDPTRSNVAIAKLLGCTHGHVAETRNKMLAAGELPPPGPTIFERVLEAVRADPSVTASDLAAALGAPRNTIYGALHRARKRLRESGEF
jgi:DNA-binding transcriptional regulator YhcF (GntR family)